MSSPAHSVRDDLGSTVQGRALHRGLRVQVAPSARQPGRDARQFRQDPPSQRLHVEGEDSRPHHLLDPSKGIIDAMRSDMRRLRFCVMSST